MIIPKHVVDEFMTFTASQNNGRAIIGTKVQVPLGTVRTVKDGNIPVRNVAVATQEDMLQVIRAGKHIIGEYADEYLTVQLPYLYWVEAVD